MRQTHGNGYLSAAAIAMTGLLSIGCILVGTAAWGANASFTLVHTGAMDGSPSFSSPCLVDLDGNRQTLEIVVGDEAGNVYGFDSAGNRMWKFSIRSFTGYEWIQTACQSSPAVADLNGDGRMEVIVTLASRDERNAAKPGAMFWFSLDANGRNPTTAGGRSRRDTVLDPTAQASGFYAAPTVADLNGDGNLEILATSWDFTCYALHQGGTLVWNLDYDLTNDREYGFMCGDTIWTTPCVLDIDSDGVLEVVFGADAHEFPWGHQIPFQSHNGGVVLVLHAPTGLLEYGPAPTGAGKFFIESRHAEGSDWWFNPNGENHIPIINPSQVLQSSPVVGDVDADGHWEIVHGTGQPVYAPADANHNRVFCWNGENATSRWVANVNDEVYACCALGNVDGNPDLEVFVRNMNTANPMFYGLKGSTGAVLAGFPRPITGGNPRSIGAVIGDVEGDGDQEIILLSFGQVHVFGPSGTQEANFPVPGGLYTSPAIGDVDGDGRCELVVAVQNAVQIYRCSGTLGAILWGQYRHDAINSGVVPKYDSTAASLNVTGDPVAGGQVQVRVRFHNTGSVVWSRATVGLSNLTAGSQPPVILVGPSDQVANGRTLDLTFSITLPTQTGPCTLAFQLFEPGASGFGEIARRTINITGGGGLPNIGFSSWDFGPEAPTQVRPGDPIGLAAFVQNTGGTATGPFWLEFWGSRTGGLTLDVFLANSAGIGSLAAGTGYSYWATPPLYSVPDGPYTVVFAADRPNDVAESDEQNNRAAVAGKRLLVLRPQTNADLTVEGFSFAPNPIASGQTISLGGRVRNVGTQNSGPFWIEFWGSFDRLYPGLHFFLCDSIGVANLAPGAAVDLSLATRTLYPVPSGTFMAGVFIDRIDQVNEANETNNYVFLDGIGMNRVSAADDGEEPNGESPEEEQSAPAKAASADLVLVNADFSPWAPVQMRPGGTLTIGARVENRGTVASTPCWLEFWGSRLGGLSLDEFVTDSAQVPALQPGGSVNIFPARPLYSIPDGPYTVTIVVDRPGAVPESNEANNRQAVPGKRLLTIRPMTQSNLSVTGFTFGPNPIRRGQRITLGGQVRNTGSTNTGSFWIEFWGSFNEAQPSFDFFLCDSIGVGNLTPGASVSLSTYVRNLYTWTPVGEFAFFCFADRTDLVNETNETDNYRILRDQRIAP